MKVHRFDVRVVVPDDAVESALIARVRAAVDVLAGDRRTEVGLNVGRIRRHPRARHRAEPTESAPLDKAGVHV
jgi:hypothetical protein